MSGSPLLGPRREQKRSAASPNYQHRRREKAIKPTAEKQRRQRRQTDEICRGRQAKDQCSAVFDPSKSDRSAQRSGKKQQYHDTIAKVFLPDGSTGDQHCQKCGQSRR